MSSIDVQLLNPDDRQHWDCVHQCPLCGHANRLSEINLKQATTGIIQCPSCRWTGQLQILVVERLKVSPKNNSPA